LKTVPSSVDQVLAFPRLQPMLRSAAGADTSARRAGPSPDLAATIRAVSDGDEDAFGRLYADYVRLVHAILLGRVPRADVDVNAALCNPELHNPVVEVENAAFAQRRQPDGHGPQLELSARIDIGPDVVADRERIVERRIGPVADR